MKDRPPAYTINYKIKKRMKVNSDSRQLFVRIPKELKEFLNIKKSDEIEFIVDPKAKKEGQHSFRLIKKK